MLRPFSDTVETPLPSRSANTGGRQGSYGTFATFVTGAGGGGNSSGRSSCRPVEEHAPRSKIRAAGITRRMAFSYPLKISWRNFTTKLRGSVWFSYHRSTITGRQPLSYHVFATSQFSSSYTMTERGHERYSS